MLITSVQIHNYKGFRSTSEIKFAGGVNVIVGQNDVGKTALLEVISLKFFPSPHRALQSSTNTISVVRIVATFGPEELKKLLRTAPIVMFDVATDIRDAEARFRSLLSSGATLDLDFSAPGGMTRVSLVEDQRRGMNAVLLFRWDESTRDFVRITNMSSGTRIKDVLASVISQRIYAFRAERLNIGTSAFGDAHALHSDASNLPEVLNTLQSTNPARFDRFNQYVTSIFPSIQRIGVRPVGNQLQVVVWSIDPVTEREDLAIPLHASGTGIGQVLSILYVVLTAQHPQVILIDEPQSFLHPGAIRKLLNILKKHSQHQFIITTHSPLAISEAEPRTITLIRKEGMESTVQALDPRAADHLRLVLSDVGARISDVFGAENILWVEGSTEELCFPRILAETSLLSLLGTVIIGVENTGDFETKKRMNAFGVYERLSSQADLLPRMIGFLFDREGRTEKEREELTRRSNGKVRFLPRRMYENYLLHPRAIHEVLVGLGNVSESLTLTSVENWISERKKEPDYYSSTPISDETWLTECDGAKFLKRLFGELTNHTIEYRKKEHGLMLTNWLIEHQSEHLAEISDLLVEMLSH